MSEIIKDRSDVSYPINMLRIEVTFSSEEAAIHHPNMVFFNIPCDAESAMRIALQQSKKYPHSLVKIFQGIVCRIEIKDCKIVGMNSLNVYFPHAISIPLKYHDLIINN